MNSKDGQVYSVRILYFCFILLSTTVCSQNINKHIVNKSDVIKYYGLHAFSVGITILNQRIIQKDDIEFVIEFPCLLGHLVSCFSMYG